MYSVSAPFLHIPLVFFCTVPSSSKPRRPKLSPHPFHLEPCCSARMEDPRFHSHNYTRASWRLFSFLSSERGEETHSIYIAPLRQAKVVVKRNALNIYIYCIYIAPLRQAKVLVKRNALNIYIYCIYISPLSRAKVQVKSCRTPIWCANFHF